ncbi:hypothetical protein [Proteus myxofaciens]|uniref:Uncharacterized protein n=1 Tax=Proteus myxofaciens ATCC 19692 TaxID=1354337 RepID=A0A198GRF7_9GAMM|nr:hypothetical protein [Proteus myxofaciens]OAT39460.1 hypothetical protein M983_0004 [Proteus myxofaciens ATCC 19692]
MIYIKNILSMGAITLTLFSSIALASVVASEECPPSVPKCDYISFKGHH